MFSVVLLERDQPDHPLRPEMIVRSLGWLVSAVVAGSVRDVVLTASGTTEFREIAEVTGCEFVRADDEAGRLQGAAHAARSQRVLVILMGYTADAALTEELDQLERSADGHQNAYVLRASKSLADTLRPVASRAVAVVVSRERCSAASSFEDLVRACRSGARLLTQMRLVG